MVKNYIFLLNLLLMYCRADPMLVNYVVRSQPLEYYVQNMATNGSVTNFEYSPDSPNSPANWVKFAPNCGGMLQSPINIETKTAIKFSKNLGHIHGTKWAEIPTSIAVDNNGHTVRFIFEYSDNAHPTISLNGGLYELGQLHFHFGLNRKSGSEHYINNRGFTMEGHAVFFNLKYETLTNALKFTDGLAVIGRLYDEVEHRTTVNTDFSFLQNILQPNDIHFINAEGTTPLFSLENIMGPLNLPYYMYHGSLTTPACNEVVTWCVGAKTLRISGFNMFQFRLLIGHEGLMARNIRPLQLRNGRSIYFIKAW